MVVKKCENCNAHMLKWGFYKNKQKYRCKHCGKCKVSYYSYNGCRGTTGKQIKMLLAEGCGIRSIGRLLNIADNTVMRKIKIMASQIKKPPIPMNQSYQLDEMRTYIGSKRNVKWIVYAINEKTKKVAALHIGSRTKSALRRVTDTLLLSKAKTIKTDGLNVYKTLIPEKIHRVKRHGINYIERMNLTLRIKLKRLARKTICYSKSQAMLESSIKLVVWE